MIADEVDVGKAGMDSQPKLNSSDFRFREDDAELDREIGVDCEAITITARFSVTTTKRCKLCQGETTLAFLYG